MDLASISHYEDGEFFALFKKIDNNIRIGNTAGDSSCILHTDGFHYKILGVSESKDDLDEKRKAIKTKFETHVGVVRSKSVNRKKVFDIIEIYQEYTVSNNTDLEKYFIGKQKDFKTINDSQIESRNGYSFARKSNWKGENVIEMKIRKDLHRTEYLGREYEIFSIFQDSKPTKDIVDGFLANGYELVKINISKKQDGEFSYKILEII